MDRKRLRHVEVKAAGKGEVSAVFATFNVVDSDGDVTLPGAFTEGAEVLISAYGHQSWSGAKPVGKGTIRTTAAEAIMDGQLFLDTADGRETLAVLKQLGALQQWSYGYDVLDADHGVFDGKDVQFLKAMAVHEVSPVLLAAGVNTRTLAAKARKYVASLTPEEMSAITAASEYSAAIRPHETAVTVKRWDPQAVVDDIEAGATVDDLRAVHAWVDPAGDPTVKSSYRFPHHHGPAGEANMRACLSTVAVLNGAKGDTDLTEAERRGVYNHLVAHLVDGDREPPELRAGTDSNLKFHEEAGAVLAGLDGLLMRTSEVMALRRSKGKALASQSVDILEWVYDDMRHLRTMLDTPQEDAAREYARYVRHLLHTGEPT